MNSNGELEIGIFFRMDFIWIGTLFLGSIRVEAIWLKSLVFGNFGKLKFYNSQVAIKESGRTFVVYLFRASFFSTNWKRDFTVNQVSTYHFFFFC